ncbi:hypothetical protein Tco_0719813 [Tanacetum coccineum]
MLRACPRHGFTELTQVDTFYNGLNDNDQDSLNVAAGGNLLSKMTREALNIIENKSKVCYSRNKPNASRMNTTSRESVSKTNERIDKFADQLSTLVEIVSKKVVTPAPIKAVEEICVTCSGLHAALLMVVLILVAPPNRVSNQMAPPGFAPVQNNGQNRFNQNQGQGNNFNRENNFHSNQGFQAQNNHAPNFQNQGFQNQPFQVPNNQVQQEFSNEFSSYKRNNDQMMRNMQNQINSLKGDLKNEIQNTIKSQQAVMMNQQTTFQNNLQNMICGLFQNQASTSGTLPSNTIPNPKGEMKAITTRSGVAYEGPSIPTNPSPKKVVERETEETTDKEQSNFQGSTAQIPPLVTPISIPEPDVPKTLPKTTPIPEPDVLKNLPNPNIPYPSRLNKEKFREKASYQKERFFKCSKIYALTLASQTLLNFCCLGVFVNTAWRYFVPPSISYAAIDIREKVSTVSFVREKCSVSHEEVDVDKFHRGVVFLEIDQHKFSTPVDNEAVTFNLDKTTRYTSTNDKSVNRIDIIDAVCEEYAPELLGFSNNDSSGGNPTPTSEPLTFEFILEEIEAYLKDDSISPEIDYADCDPEGDICLIENLLNNDPFQLPPMDLKQSEVTKAKHSIEEPPELELKDLLSHLEYAFLEENNKLPVIIAKGLKDNEKEALLKVLKSHKWAIAWKITDTSRVLIVPDSHRKYI